ncbi:MAG: TIGR03619 family F420-dependent LLM class oxidoreductase [Novosphingobium sp.]|nr:TIGR03619 family F420-dependent LLM class oxidoreductase [Novosphingobium sp.]
MKFGLNTLSLFVGGAPAELMADVAQCAEDLGFDSMWMGHHVQFPKTIVSEYPYGRNPMTSATPRLDTFVTLTYLAAKTTTMRFGSGVYLAPMIDPLVSARAIMSADYLSGGRIMLGLGVGWCEEEFAMLGQDFASRGRRTDEIIALFRELFTQETIHHQGEFYRYEPINFEPKPIQKPWPPMYWGGISPPALRRAAGLDGLFMPLNDIEAVRRAVDTVRKLREEGGKGDEPYDFTAVTPFPMTEEAVRAMEEIGVCRLTFDLGITALEATPAPVSPTFKDLSSNLRAIAGRFIG